MSLVFLFFAALLAIPWPLCRALGWEADLSLISGTFWPTDGQILRVGATILARLSFVLVAPIFGIAGGIRLLILAASAVISSRWG